MGEVNANIAALSAAFKASGARIACLCSSDTVYAGEAADAARALAESGAKHIYLAGRPGEREGEFRAAGIQDFIYAGCNVLTVLREAHDILAA
jgi:methylmalonyl-CoA mutase